MATLPQGARTRELNSTGRRPDAPRVFGRETRAGRHRRRGSPDASKASTSSSRSAVRDTSADMRRAERRADSARAHARSTSATNAGIPAASARGARAVDGRRCIRDAGIRRSASSARAVSSARATSEWRHGGLHSIDRSQHLGGRLDFADEQVKTRADECARGVALARSPCASSTRAADSSPGVARLRARATRVQTIGCSAHVAASSMPDVRVRRKRAAPPRQGRSCARSDRSRRAAPWRLPAAPGPARASRNAMRISSAPRGSPADSERAADVRSESIAATMECFSARRGSCDGAAATAVPGNCWPRGGGTQTLVRSSRKTLRRFCGGTLAASTSDFAR